MLKTPDDVSETLSKVLIKTAPLLEPARTLNQTVNLPIRKCDFWFWSLGCLHLCYAWINRHNFNNFATKPTQCINNAFHISSLPAYFNFWSYGKWMAQRSNIQYMWSLTYDKIFLHINFLNVFSYIPVHVYILTQQEQCYEETNYKEDCHHNTIWFPKWLNQSVNLDLWPYHPRMIFQHQGQYVHHPTNKAKENTCTGNKISILL